MIVGTGVDIEEVARIEEAVTRHGRRFLERVFTAREIGYVEGTNQPYQRYAARFAAKEAGMKALGTGWDRGVRWLDLEVVNDGSGRPSLALHGRAAAIAGEMGCTAVHVSLSHTRHHAVAQVIFEKQEAGELIRGIH